MSKDLGVELVDSMKNLFTSNKKKENRRGQPMSDTEPNPSYRASKEEDSKPFVRALEGKKRDDQYKKIVDKAARD